MLKENNVENKQEVKKTKKEDLLPQNLFDYVQVKIALPREKPRVVPTNSKPYHSNRHAPDHDEMLIDADNASEDKKP